MAVHEHHETRKINQQDDWTLNAPQMIFMLQHHNAIEAAYANDDMDFLRELAASDAFIAAFGDIPWDEAYDRYETMLEGDGGSA